MKYLVHESGLNSKYKQLACNVHPYAENGFKDGLIILISHKALA